MKLTKTIRPAYIAIAVLAAACVLLSFSLAKAEKAGAQPCKIETKGVYCHSEFFQPAYELWQAEVRKNPQLKNNHSEESAFVQRAILKKLNEKYGPEGWLLLTGWTSSSWAWFYRIVEETPGGKTAPLFRVEYAVIDNSPSRIFVEEKDKLLKKLGLRSLTDLPDEKQIATEGELRNLAFRRFVKDGWIKPRGYAIISDLAYRLFRR